MRDFHFVAAVSDRRTYLSMLVVLVASFIFQLTTQAQTNAATATLPSTNQTGPVVLPPPDKAPVAPANPQFQFNQPQQAPSPAPTLVPFPSPPPGTNPSSAPAPNPIVSPPPAESAPLVVAPGAVAPPTTTIRKGEEIYDIRPPVFFLHGWLWLLPLLLAFVLLSLFVLVWLWFDRRASRLNPLTAYDVALRKIEEARPLMNVEDPAPYAVAVSEAIRTYLTQRFTTPSDRRTTDEFLREMETNPDTPFAAHRDLLRDFLQACDLLKFAQYHPQAEELELAHQRAVTFVTATKPVPEPVPRPRAEAKLVTQTA